MELEELFEKGLLKHASPSREKAEKSMVGAEKYLCKAKKVFDSGMDDVAVLLAYSSAFHAARALLFLDGVSERSHYAIGEYLRSEHPEIGAENIRALDMYRGLRHSVAYGLDTEIGAQDGKSAIEFAGKFLESAGKCLSSNPPSSKKPFKPSDGQ